MEIPLTSAPVKVTSFNLNPPLSAAPAPGPPSVSSSSSSSSSEDEDRDHYKDNKKKVKKDNKPKPKKEKVKFQTSHEDLRATSPGLVSGASQPGSIFDSNKVNQIKKELQDSQRESERKGQE